VATLALACVVVVLSTIAIFDERRIAHLERRVHALGVVDQVITEASASTDRLTLVP
jgi:hypothetical protein